MTAFDELSTWDDRALAKRLGWYRNVAENRLPARFRVARTVPLSLSPEDASEDALRDELDRLTPVFEERRRRIAESAEALGQAAAGPDLLDLCRALVWRMLAHCNFCEWDCRVDRTGGAKFGACKLAAQSRVSTYFHHLGEELVYRGRSGSGTIFFTSCNMRCAFCQNGDIAADKDNGTVVDARTLATMAWLLRMEGCHNINWVGGDPTIHLHAIVDAIWLLGGEFAMPSRRDLGAALPMKADPFRPGVAFPMDGYEGGYKGAFNAPMLWNSNFFMSEDAMKLLRILIDVWLPDFKFGPGRCAVTLSRTPRYWETVTRNLGLVEDWGGDATIRHLIMPNHVECCTFPVLDWIAENMPGVPVNIMDQYRPETCCDPSDEKYSKRYAGMARRPTPDEIQAAYRHAQERRVNYQTITHEKNTMGLFA